MHYADITNAIATLVIANITIKDIDEVVDEAIEVQRGNTLLYPDPSSPIAELTTEAQSLGLESTRYRNYRYTINYRMLYGVPGEGRGIADILPGLITRATAVMEAITETEFASSGGMEVIPSVKSVGLFADAANNQYYGALITVSVMEFGEV